LRLTCIPKATCPDHRVHALADYNRLYSSEDEIAVCNFGLHGETGNGMGWGTCHVIPTYGHGVQ